MLFMHSATLPRNKANRNLNDVAKISSLNDALVFRVSDLRNLNFTLIACRVIPCTYMGINTNR